jgi:type IV pilus assembly protein PilE
MKKTSRGFTLIELMIVIAIIGALAAVGYPAYTSSVQKGKRADGIGGLLSLAGRMEEFYMNANTYTTATVANPTSPDGFYTLSITAQTDFGYTLTATTIPVGADTECGNLILNSLGQKTDSAGNGNCW